MPPDRAQATRLLAVTWRRERCPGGRRDSQGFPLRASCARAIVQDAESGRVLMLAWMDDEALRLTRETGEAHFYSRSRERLWHKGETSGNTLAVEELRDDCDGDAYLLRVRPNGPACHTGSVSCFAPWLWRTVARACRHAARRLVRGRGSWTAGRARGRAEARRGGRRGRARRGLRGRRAASSPRSPTSGSRATSPSRRAGSTRRRSRTSCSGGVG